MYPPGLDPGMNIKNKRIWIVVGVTIAIFTLAYSWHQNEKKEEWECLQRIEFYRSDSGYYRLDGDRAFGTQEEALRYCTAKTKHVEVLNVENYKLEVEENDFWAFLVYEVWGGLMFNLPFVALSVLFGAGLSKLFLGLFFLGGVKTINPAYKKYLIAACAVLIFVIIKMSSLV